MKNNQVITYQVVNSVADFEGTDPYDLPVLYKSIDCSALDSLFRSLEGGAISFNYSDSHIEINSDGYLTIEPVQPNQEATDALRSPHTR